MKSVARIADHLLRLPHAGLPGLLLRLAR